MNLFEALKSGKPYKMKSWAKWCSQSETVHCTKEQALSEEWETQRPSREFTREQIMEAVKAAIPLGRGTFLYSQERFREIEFIAEQVTVKLGFRGTED